MLWGSTIYNMSGKEDFQDLETFFNQNLLPEFDANWGYRYVRVESTEEMIDLTILIHRSYLVISDIENQGLKQASRDLQNAKSILNKLQVLNSNQECEYLEKINHATLFSKMQLGIGNLYHKNFTSPNADACLKKMDIQLSFIPERPTMNNLFSKLKEATIRCCSNEEIN